MSGADNTTDDRNAMLFREAERAYESDKMEVAIDSFTKLCNDGVAEACQYLGFIFGVSHNGATLDNAQSRFWYGKYFLLLRQRMVRGDADACLLLGKHYQYGDEIAQDHEKARSLIAEAAEKGLPGAQFHLANLYRFGGCGVSTSMELYSYWLGKAVVNRFPEALYQRGLDLLSEGSTGSSDKAWAVIEEAALLGCLTAQEHLGRRV